MVAHLLQFVTECEERLQRNQYVPKFSYGRWMLRHDGGPNRFVLMYLTVPRDVAPTVPALFRHFRYEVRPSSIQIVFRLGFWVTFCFIFWNNSSCPYYNSFRTTIALACRRAKIVCLCVLSVTSYRHGNNVLAGAFCAGSHLGVRIVQRSLR